MTTVLATLVRVIDVTNNVNCAPKSAATTIPARPIDRNCSTVLLPDDTAMPTARARPVNVARQKTIVHASASTIRMSRLSGDNTSTPVMVRIRPVA